MSKKLTTDFVYLVSFYFNEEQEQPTKMVFDTIDDYHLFCEEQKPFRCSFTEVILMCRYDQTAEEFE